MDYDILIVGGGPAGLSAAINGRARGKTVLLLSSPREDSPLWKAERVENYLGLPGVTGAELLTAFHRLRGGAPGAPGPLRHAGGGPLVSQRGGPGL